MGKSHCDAGDRGALAQILDRPLHQAEILNATN